MLQRNTSGEPLVLPTLDPPVTVYPGDTVDHPRPLAGFGVALPVRPPENVPIVDVPLPPDSTDDTAPATKGART